MGQVRDLGFGTFGVAKLMRKLDTGELVAVKLLPRGSLVHFQPRVPSIFVHPLHNASSAAAFDIP